MTTKANRLARETMYDDEGHMTYAPPPPVPLSGDPEGPGHGADADDDDVYMQPRGKVIFTLLYISPLIESRGRVVTSWPGSQEVGGSIPGCATKFVRCKNLAFNIGECVSHGSDTT